MIVTKNEVRQLVDRLSKPKFNKRVERELASINQDMPIQEPVIITSRHPSKSIATSSTNTAQKKTTFLWYNTCSSFNG